MKTEKISMKWKVFSCLLLFIALLLMVLWLFQTVYLGTFYKQIKRNELKSAMDNLISSRGVDDYDEAVRAIAKSYDISVYVFDQKGEVLYSSQEEMLHLLIKDQFAGWYQRAWENGGEYVENRSWSPEEILQRDVKGIAPEQPEQERQPEQPEQAGQLEQPSQPERLEPPDVKKSEPEQPNLQKFWDMPGMPRQTGIEETVTWVRIIADEEAGEWVYLLESVITPVDATVHTLRIQLIYISVIMVLLSVLMALFLSKILTRSIVRLNTSAKELAKANYDITFEAGDYKEIAELSQTLNYATKELGKTERFQRELLANVSHDLRTPLTMIIAYGEMMRDLPGENTPENVQVIIDEAKRLTTLVNDMLDISKLQAGAITLSERTYSLTDSIREVVERVSRMLEPEGYRIDFQYGEEVYVKADEEKLHQVIYNLVGNAVNYTGEDKCVTVRQISTGDAVRIEVMDTGEGIPEESLPYVWERYYKVNKNHKRAITGTGLGLSIVKNILKLHGAEYGAESEEGKGSTFWFELKKEKMNNL